MIIYKTAENVNKQVTNLAGDPAFKPVVKIPVPEEVSVKRSAKECSSQVSFKYYYKWVLCLLESSYHHD